VAAPGIVAGQLWLVVLGYGVIGGSLASHYTVAFLIMIGLLVVAFVCNELIRAVPQRHFVDGAGAPAADVEEGATR
jgi:hypothetical protein